MSNVSAFFNTLVAAASEASAALVGQTQLVDAVYKDYQPVTLAPYNTLQIPLPDQAPLSEIGSNDFTPVDISAQMVSLTFQNHPGIAYVVRDFDQYRSAESIRTLFLDATFKRAIEYLNGQIANLITTANFNAYAPIASTGGSANLAIADYAKAWGNLAAGKIPVQDSGQMRLAVHPDVYANLLTNPAWVQESMVGRLIADPARRDAWLGQQFGAHVVWDQQMPKTGGTSSTSPSYTALYFHQYAIALGLRHLPEPDGRVVEYTTVFVKGIPMRVMIGYNQIKAGYICSCDFGFALGVCRPNFGQILTM
jgi:hypothetical protein